MRTTGFRRIFRNAALAAAIALVSAAAPSIVAAQVVADTGAMRTTDDRDDGDDDGMDLGWIGLLGLAGLAGLRKKDHVVHHTDTTATRRP